MDGLCLPYVLGDVSLAETIDHMNALDRRAVVVLHEDNDLMLYMNRAVLQAYAGGVSLARDIPREQGERVASFYWQGLSTAETSYFYEAIERALDEQEAGYGALFYPEQSPGSIVVVTRHETGKEHIIAATRYCVCNINPRNHWEQEPPAHKGNDCRWCNGTYDVCA